MERESVERSRRLHQIGFNQKEKLHTALPRKKKLFFSSKFLPSQHQITKIECGVHLPTSPLSAGWKKEAGLTDSRRERSPLHCATVRSLSPIVPASQPFLNS